MQMLAYLLARFSEPSSYAGLGAALALLGWNFSATITGQLVQLLAAACGLLALVLKERGVLKAIVLVLAVAPALSGCAGTPAILGGIGAAGSVFTAVDRITQATDPYIATACIEYRKSKAVADAVAAAGAVPAVIAAKLPTIESFGDAACAHPPSGDPLSTAIWLGRLTGQLAALTASPQ